MPWQSSPFPFPSAPHSPLILDDNHQREDYAGIKSVMTSVKTTLRSTKKHVDAVNFAKGSPGAVADMGVRGRDTGFPVKNQRARKRGGFPFSFFAKSEKSKG